MQRNAIIAGGLIVLAGLCGMVWWTSRDVAPEPAALVEDAQEEALPLRRTVAPRTTSVTEDAPPVAPANVAEAEQSGDPVCPRPPPQPPPPLDESDGFVRERLTCVGALAPMWLEASDLARRASVLLENAKTGGVPRRHVAFMALQSPFRVMQREGGVYVDPASYHRYNRATDVLTCLAPERAAALVRRFEPLLVAALTELGVAAQGADGHIEAALAQVEATPMPPGRVALARPKALYEYADPALEALPPLQKQLLRMGPANLARLQDYARQVRAALAAPAPCPAA